MYVHLFLTTTFLLIISPTFFTIYFCSISHDLYDINLNWPSTTFLCCKIQWFCFGLRSYSDIFEVVMARAELTACFDFYSVYYHHNSSDWKALWWRTSCKQAPYATCYYSADRDQQSEVVVVVFSFPYHCIRKFRITSIL